MTKLPWSVNRRSCVLALTAWCVLSPNLAHADMAAKIGKLPAKIFCINASFDVTWETALAVLKEMGLETTLVDQSHGVMTTAFASARPQKLRQISGNARFLKNGRFSLKLLFKQISPAYTKAEITLQIRQSKIVGSSERLLKSRGSFEKFVAFRINQLSISKQFPQLYEYRLGFDLVPDIEKDRYVMAHVEKKSPAGEAGFKNGDLLLEIDGRPVSLRGELFDCLLDGSAEKQMRFRFRREDSEMELPVWVIRVRETGEKIGMALNWDETLRRFQVAAIEPDSRAEKAGLKVGDILVKEGDLQLDSWTQYYRALSRLGQGSSTIFEINRTGQSLTLTV